MVIKSVNGKPVKSSVISLLYGNKVAAHTYNNSLNTKPSRVSQMSLYEFNLAFHLVDLSNQWHKFTANSSTLNPQGEEITAQLYYG